MLKPCMIAIRAKARIAVYEYAATVVDQPDSAMCLAQHKPYKAYDCGADRDYQNERPSSPLASGATREIRNIPACNSERRNTEESEKHRRHRDAAEQKLHCAAKV